MKNDLCKKRAFLKMGLIVFMAVVLVAILSHFVTDQVLDELKHSLSLWTIIILVVIINLVSFVCFIVLYFAYQWVRCDLKPEKDDVLEN